LCEPVLINIVLKIYYLGFIFFNDREANRGDMECFLVKVDVFMEWKCQPTGIVEFLRFNSRVFGVDMSLNGINR
tara:strand:+ start:49 stop:270 length:222 start_codon:yes stop_codon:yes gene_type:complete